VDIKIHAGLDKKIKESSTGACRSRRDLEVIVRVRRDKFMSASRRQGYGLMIKLYPTEKNARRERLWSRELISFALFVCGKPQDAVIGMIAGRC
jgi:hypothetical protein